MNKDENSLTGKVSTPLCVAELLTELLKINEAKGKVIYDACIGVGALSSKVDTNKHIKKKSKNMEQKVKKQEILEEKVKWWEAELKKLELA